MRRGLISIVVALTTLVAMAQVEFIQNGLKYTALDDNSVKVRKIDDNHLPKGKLVIPAYVTHDGVTYTVTTLGGWAFFGCEDITEVELPATLTKIDIWAFCNCKKLKGIDIPSSVKEIGYSAFENCESFTSFTFPEGIELVSDRLLQECYNLTEVNLPEGVVKIDDCAFSDCKSLESITLPQSVKYIDNSAFAYCNNLKHISLPKGLKKLGRNVFSSCVSLVEIELPEGITEIGDNVFNNCRALEQVTLPASLSWLKSNPFSSCGALKEYKVAEGSEYFAVQDGILFSKDMTRLIACPVSKDLGDYIVPATVKEIASDAFYGCSRLTSITMSDVTDIGDNAFNGCHNLVTVDFGSKLETLGKAAFYSNSKIENIVLPDSFKHMDMINFEFCGNLKTVSLSEELSKREQDFNNLSFNFNSSDLRFIIRMPDGTTKTLKHEEINDMKKYFREK
ncbi:MAG: leucine-rich repeat domain-containing protein [Muribaculaceae bacterium]|nr:leucine-rich repeat domain-containing protein [Muribaculaceae bacterium]